jgi:adenosylcobinamide-phosphate synthase
MSFLATLIALLLEQARPLSLDNPVYLLMRAWARWVRRSVDVGKEPQAWLAWVLAVGVPALLVLAVHWLLYASLGWFGAAPWSALVLYFTLGFRQFSHFFTEIRDALEMGDEPGARALLVRWQQVDANALPQREIVRHVIEYSVLAAHRHVFGVLFWFSVLAAFGLGPLGAVLYRLAEFVGRYWRHKSENQQQPVSPALQDVATRAWWVLDWLPVRSTALGFAVVGSFEDAVDAWRRHAIARPLDNDGVLIAATAGAIGVRLGGTTLRPVATAGTHTEFAHVRSADVSDTTSGRDPELGHLRSVVGLVWRTVVVWMVLLALLTLARLLG